MARARPNKLPLLIAAAGVFLVVLNMGPALLKPGDIDLYMLHLSWKGSRVELNPWNNSTGATIGDSPGTEHKKEEAAQEVKPADLSPAHIAIPDEISGCVDEALRRVKALGETLTGTAGPLVVGGIGDSGTRGAAELLMDFGCIMGDKHMTNSAHDSMYFHHDYSVRLPKYKKLRKRSYKDIAYPCITSAQSLIYGRTSLKSHFGAVSGDTKWFSGLQWISSMVSKVELLVLLHWRVSVLTLAVSSPTTTLTIRRSSLPFRTKAILIMGSSTGASSILAHSSCFRFLKPC